MGKKFRFAWKCPFCEATHFVTERSAGAPRCCEVCKRWITAPTRDEVRKQIREREEVATAAPISTIAKGEEVATGPPVSSHAKGKDFESDIKWALELLAEFHPESVRVTCQPRVRLHNGLFLIPDFDLHYTLPHETGSYLIECQNRKRSSPDILHKIRNIKNVSERNTFIFVHPSGLISEAVRKAMDSDGVMHMELHAFYAFIARFAHTIEAIKEYQVKYDLLEELIKNRLPPKRDHEKRERRGSGTAPLPPLPEVAPRTHRSESRRQA